MVTGNGSFFISPKQKPSGAPFADGSADEGLSVDSVSGKIQLGNLLGDPLQPGKINGFRTVDIVAGAQLSFNIEAGADMQINFINDPFNTNGFSITGQNNGGGNIRQLVIDVNGLLGVANDAGNANIFSRFDITSTSAELTNSDGVLFSRLDLSNAGIALYSGSQLVVQVGANLFQTLTPINTATANPLILPNGSNATWWMGNPVAGAVAFDNANYIEVNINGTVYKLALAV